MTAEFDVYGVFLPAFFVWMLIALVAHLVLRRAMTSAGIYRHVWHQPLFDGALYAIILFVTVLLGTMYVK
jgi:hypothetical protein